MSLQYMTGLIWKLKILAFKTASLTWIFGDIQQSVFSCQINLKLSHNTVFYILNQISNKILKWKIYHFAKILPLRVTVAVIVKIVPVCLSYLASKISAQWL